MDSEMHDKTVVITGANSGIGFVSARSLAGMGAQVVLACRRTDAAVEARAAILAEHPRAWVETVRLDLASLESVRNAAEDILGRFPIIDVLINNAGVARIRREETEDGFERTFATNHLGPFLLTNLLLPAIRAARGRIVNVASAAHGMGQIHFDDPNLATGYGVMKAYSQSKLANILFTRELARRLDGTGVTVSALHPGTVNTNIWPGERWYERLVSSVIRRFTISAEAGAGTVIWLASAPEMDGQSGGYYQQCQPARTSSKARDMAAARRLWDLSEEMVGLAAG